MFHAGDEPMLSRPSIRSPPNIANKCRKVIQVSSTQAITNADTNQSGFAAEITLRQFGEHESRRDILVMRELRASLHINVIETAENSRQPSP